MNSLRIGIVGVLVNYWGPQDADGFLHMFEGWIIFIACAGMLAAEIYLLARLTSGKAFFEVFYAPKVQAKPAQRSNRCSQAFACHLCPALSCFAQPDWPDCLSPARQEIVPRALHLQRFQAASENGVDAHPRSIAQTEHFLGLTDYILTDFTKPDRRSVNFYVAYYASQRNGVVTSFARCLHSGQRLADR